MGVDLKMPLTARQSSDHVGSWLYKKSSTESVHTLVELGHFSLSVGTLTPLLTTIKV